MSYTLIYSLINNDTEYEVTGYSGNLTEVVIPNEYEGLPITSIGAHAFEYCTSLKSVRIGKGVTNIKYCAFRECTSLEKITIGNSSVTDIGSYAFYRCSSLTSIVIPDSVTVIGNYAFKECTSLKSVRIGNKVEYINYEAFSYCTSLTSIIIPDSVIEIGRDAFRECTSLEKITIGNSVTGIGDYAFAECTSLKSVVIPSNVIVINNWVFYKCSSLISVSLFAKTVPSAGQGIFQETNSSLKIYCYESVLDNYKTATNWNIYANNFVGDNMRLFLTAQAIAQKKLFNDYKQDIEQKVGDVETALDTIIEIQNSLLGGVE